MDLLRWLRDNGCPFDETICKDAANRGHLEALKWFAENHFPLEPSTSRSAAQGAHLDVIKWVLKEGYKWPAGACENLRCRHPQIAQWLTESGGCPCQKFAGFCSPVRKSFALYERPAARALEEGISASNTVEEIATAAAANNDDANEATGRKEGTRGKTKKPKKSSKKDGDKKKKKKKYSDKERKKEQ